MDPQQELFSALLVELRKKYKDTDTGVYDTFLPPEGTSYPFVYMGDSEQNTKKTKSNRIGSCQQIINVWHSNPRQRGTVSGLLSEITSICKKLEHTAHYSWMLKNVTQRIVPDTTTKQPLLHGILEVEFWFS